MLSLFISHHRSQNKTKQTLLPKLLTSFSIYSRSRGRSTYNQVLSRGRSTGFQFLPLASSTTLNKTFPHVSFLHASNNSENEIFLTLTRQVRIKTIMKRKKYFIKLKVKTKYKNNILDDWQSNPE